MLDRTIVAALAIFTLGVACSNPVSAELVTSEASVPGAAQTIDFSQFFPTGQVIVKKNAPIGIDLIPDESVLLRVLSAPGDAYLLGQHGVVYPDNNFYLGGNGKWGPERNGFLGANGGFDRVVMRIEFLTGPVSYVGGLFNYVTDVPIFLPVYIYALDQNLEIIERHTVDVEAPISTPSATGVGGFRGISRGKNEIYALEIDAHYAVIDDIRFFRVPEPDVTALLVIAVIAAERVRRTSR